MLDFVDEEWSRLFDEPDRICKCRCSNFRRVEGQSCRATGQQHGAKCALPDLSGTLDDERWGVGQPLSSKRLGMARDEGWHAARLRETGRLRH